MFNYKKKNVNYEYALPDKLFIDFLSGKKESDYSKYFNDFIRLIDEYDKMSTGSNHNDFYEFNYSFFLKLLTNIKGRLELVLDRNSKFISFKKNISSYIENEKIDDPDIVTEGSFFYVSIGKIEDYNQNIISIYESIQQIYQNCYTSSSHELKGAKFKEEILRIKKIISTIVLDLNKITLELEKIGVNINKLLVVCIKYKVRIVKENIFKKFDESINNEHTSNPNSGLALDKYEANFNKDIHAMVVDEVLSFKETISSYINILPDIISHNGNSNTSKSILTGFNARVDGIISVSSKINYFKNFKIHYNNTQAA